MLTNISWCIVQLQLYVLIYCTWAYTQIDLVGQQISLEVKTANINSYRYEYCSVDLDTLNYSWIELLIVVPLDLLKLF